MTFRSRSFVCGLALAASIVPISAEAADLPAIKAGSSNQVADCATPGRLMAYIRERNPNLDPRFSTVGREYMRHGEALGVRWDYAFFQMILETGYLTYGGDVKPQQNNFAGLGATGKGARGESFPDVSTGVKAHLQHLVMYSGERVENPVAERTRNIQDWGVLTSWQQGLSGPATFGDLAKKWAPTSKRYAIDMSNIAQRFFSGPCLAPDPETGLVADAGAASDAPAAAETAPAAQAETATVLPASLEAPAAGQDTPQKAAATEVAAVAVAPEADAPAVKAPVKAVEAKVDAAAAKATQPRTAAMNPPITILNQTPAAAPAAEPPPAAAPPAAKKSAEVPPVAKKPDAAATAAAPKNDKPAEKKVEVAALQGGAIVDAAKPDKKASAAQAGKCRVWTASYGGSKAIIIKALRDKTVNYTVLDVNEGAEKREADAYINAYAKGGESVGEFTSQSQALEKAFELCPEG